MRDNLQQLADKLGILTKFSDAGICKKDYYPPESVIRFFAESFGYKAGSDAEINASLEKIGRKRWQKALENIYVCEQGNIRLDIVVPVPTSIDNARINLKYQNTESEFSIPLDVVITGEEREIGKTVYSLLELLLKADLEVGYYDAEVSLGGKKYKTTLAVAPQHCYHNEALEKNKLWGFAVQLYSVRSERNWGVGDFTDLKNLVWIASRAGADIIGLNPLNVLSHDYPENCSPYCAISRLFLNPIYIDIEQVPEFNPEDIAVLQGEIAGLRNAELIDYPGVYNLKIRLLEKMYDRLLKDKKSARMAEFKTFCKEQGTELERLAVYQALYEEKTKTVWGGWKAWDEKLRNPNSLAVKEFAKEHEKRVGFFKYLQFEAARQYDEVAKAVKDAGLKVGLYRDLAVGVGQDSAELWSNYEAYVKDAGAGAPPDALFVQGQKWGLGAFNPYTLKEQGYEPFIKILRANMHGAGVIRVDHVMCLMRLYIVPNNEDMGTYIMYNFADMMNILAIESYLNRCVVVGESIGNVPEGFIEAIESKNIKSLTVLWEERECGVGDFKAPSSYPENAFASVGTHDMPPLRMWWFGYDIEERFRVGIVPDEETKARDYHARELDRWKLLFALDSNGVWPEDNLRKNNYIYGEAYPEGIEEAVHRFVSRSASKVFLAELENILHVEKMQNLPGTFRECPNWRRKLPVPLERLESDIAYIRNINAIKRER